MSDATLQAKSTSLARSLDLVAEDLSELIGLGEHVEAVISRMAAAASGPFDPSLLVDAQAADLLSQRLAGLTAFVRGLAAAERSADYAQVEAALSKLTLAEQSRRFKGRAANLAQPTEACGLPTFWD
jgi:uncharacterized membrane protein